MSSDKGADSFDLRMTFLCLPLLAVTCMLASCSEWTPPNLQDLPPHRVFRSRLEEPYSWPYPYRNSAKCVMVMADVDGDGRTDRVVFNGNRVVAGGVAGDGLWAAGQKNLPLPFHPAEGEAKLFHNVSIPFPSGYLTAAGDIDGSGYDRVFLTAVDRDASRWRLFLMDFKDASRDRDYPLPMGDDHTNDGLWDGCWLAVGVLPAGQAGDAACVVLTCSVGYDGYGREVAALDLKSGCFNWRYSLGTQPLIGQTWVGDLDEDGKWEIVMGTGGPGNLDGQVINDTSGDMSYLLVLSAHGELRNQYVLGGKPSQSWLGVADIMDGPEQEIIVATDMSGKDARDSVCVFNADGKCMDSLALTDASYGVAAHSLPNGSGGFWIAQRDGQLGYFDIKDGRIHRRASRRFGEKGSVRILGQGHYLVNGTPEVVVGLNKIDCVSIADRRCRILFSTGGVGGEVTSAATMAALDGSPVLSVAGQRFGVWLLEKDDTSWLLWLGGLLLVGLMVAGWRKITRILTPESRLSEDELFQILVELGKIRHGAFDLITRLEDLSLPISGFRCQIDQQKVGGLRDERFCRDVTELVEVSLPRLLALVRRTRRHRDFADQSREISTSIENCISALRCFLDPSVKDRFSRTAQDQFEAQVERLDKQTQQLRRMLTRLRSCDLASVLQEVLDRRAKDIEAANVVVEILPADIKQSCLIKRDDLLLIIEGLVGNALRALESVPRPVLRITVEIQHERVHLHFKDNGCGIAQDDEDRIFHGFSARPDGGTGLPLSREILKRCGGSLSLERTAAGPGCEFLLELRLA